MDNRSKNLHLLWRAGFGPDLNTIRNLDNISTEVLYINLKQELKLKPEEFAVTKNLLRELFLDYENAADAENFQKANKEMIAEQKRKTQVASRQDMKKLNELWINEMVQGKSQLREKMSLFWHGHFACRNAGSLFQQTLLHDIRINALGNFGTLLKLVSKSPAMLFFLNNQQNRKGRPNENFAREVMELFTLGRGNYTEDDVKEAARAFTGWKYDERFGFQDNPRHQDTGLKVFLGKQGNFVGENIIDILLEQKQTAKFITEKIYRFFVNDIPDKNIIEKLATNFFNSKYDIEKLMDEIFTSTWFYEEKNVSNRIKSPVELIVGIRRMGGVNPINPNTQMVFQKLLGQLLFMPPNVAGWPSGRNWIDSSTLLMRMQVPLVWASKDVLRMMTKSDDDVEMGSEDEGSRKKREENLFKRVGSAEWSWKKLYSNYERITRENLFNTMATDFLQSKNYPKKSVIEAHVDHSSREHYISSTVIQLMSTPEYQVC